MVSGQGRCQDVNTLLTHQILWLSQTDDSRDTRQSYTHVKWDQNYGSLERAG
jgi:hypothetical protein